MTTEIDATCDHPLLTCREYRAALLTTFLQAIPDTSAAEAQIDRLTAEQYDRLNAAVDHAFPRTTVGAVALAIVNEYLSTSPTGGAS